uniref:Uncharacterized protein n=1 Tax=Arundo donax TaxID=35708 RepID=A0A0A9BNB9_ARUDO
MALQIILHDFLLFFGIKKFVLAQPRSAVRCQVLV